jgi:DNA (cytosine-5)-methyltransferase 1
MRYLSVCSGIEAVSVAWEPLGWKPAMFAEIDPFCCWLLRSRFRNVIALPADGAVINAGDFTKIGANDVGAIDLLVGGTPCSCRSYRFVNGRSG